MSRLNGSTKWQYAARPLRIYLTSWSSSSSDMKAEVSKGGKCPPGEIVKHELPAVHFQFNPAVGRSISSQKRAIYHCRRSTTIIPFAPESGTERSKIHQEISPPNLVYLQLTSGMGILSRQRMGLRTSSNEASPSCSPTSLTTTSSVHERPNNF
ncbi:hypothetical protein E2320_002504 [Naja naja]|nr:hypothetical protein E2320_002504 [Naja naja]